MIQYNSIDYFSKSFSKFYHLLIFFSVFTNAPISRGNKKSVLQSDLQHALEVQSLLFLGPVLFRTISFGKYSILVTPPEPSSSEGSPSSLRISISTASRADWIE